MPSIQFLLQFLRSSFSHFVLEGKSMPNKKALLYPGQMHLRLECLCFLSCFYFLFCFSSLPDQYLPIRRSKTFSLFSSPCCWFWLKGIGVGVGERETESIYNHKDNSFSLTRPATPERIWHLSELSSKSNSYLSGCWHRRDGAQPDLQGWEWVRGFRAYIADEEVIHQQQQKDREQGAWTSLPKSTARPLGPLRHFALGHVVQTGKWWRSQLLKYSAS